MLEWIKGLFKCKHKEWKVLGTFPMKLGDEWEVGRQTFLQCKRCGASTRRTYLHQNKKERNQI